MHILNVPSEVILYTFICGQMCVVRNTVNMQIVERGGDMARFVIVSRIVGALWVLHSGTERIRSK